MKKKKTKRNSTVRKAVGATGTSKKTGNSKWLIAGLIGVTAAGIGYFGWKYIRNKQRQTAPGADTLTPLPWLTTPPFIPAQQKPVYDPGPEPKPVKEPVRRKAAAQNPDGFPLRRGSRGENVRAFQEALISTYGKQVLPRYGADGQFGSEMTAALKKLKLPAAIDETTFNIMVKAEPGKGGNKATLAKTLIDAATRKDFAAALKALKQINSTDQYSEVSNEFKTMRIGGGVRQTLVNGMLNSFADETQKRAIRLEFQRMGLQYDGSKWTLSGFDGLPIVTKVATTVWLNAKQSIQVPARTVLGNEISRRLDYTLFENKGKHFLVQTNTVTYL